jgi:hypothetical protein
VTAVKIPAEDQLGRRSRVPLETNHSRLAAQLAARSVAMESVEDLALVEGDRLVLTVLSDVLLERGELRLDHRGEHQGELVRGVVGHARVTSVDSKHRRGDFFRIPNT